MTTIIDITSFEVTIKSLIDLFDIGRPQIIEYLKREELSCDDFLAYFSINESNLSTVDFLVTSLHVTTNDDECKSLNEIGLVNSIDAVTLNTPFNRHLKKHGIDIDLKMGEIKYNKQTYTFGQKFEGWSQSEERRLLEHIAYKFYCDRQINGFFCTDNALSYGGNVNRRPELMNNIANLLNYNKLVEDWSNNSNNKCYVIKFAIPLSTYSVESFTNTTTFDNFKEKDIDLLKKKTIIDYSLSNIYNYVNHQGYVCERLSFLQPDSRVKSSDFIGIYSDTEYQKTL
ncbi:hypothetical protein [Psychrobacillus sp. FSL K6-1267]|uniref:hypothetical protein n=1 Tax=Psychrobacillus sp. FSL K6-1267 TaxID=2921543 RepID=UPI0030FA5D02